MKRRALFLLAALSATGVFAGPPATAPGTSEAATRAADAAKAFSGALRQALSGAMAEGGPAAAVAVCHDEAPRIAERVSAEHGVRLGRVGVRSRNPANRLEGWQKALLQEWQARPPAGPPSQWAPVVRQEGGTLRWARAIETEGLCLVCHGPRLEPGLEASIRARYPDDPATGFEAGSLRGLLWVEVDEAAGTAARLSETRQAIPMRETEAAELRAQMRAHLERLEGITVALANGDTEAAASLLETAAAGRPGRFRTALPEGWFRFARPMHEAFGAAAAKARAGDVPATLSSLGTALAQCNACHATWRVETPR